MRRNMFALAVIGVVTLVAACGTDEVPVATGGGDTTVASTVLEPIPAGADGLDEARERWAAAGIDDYTMTYREICFCPQLVVTVTVTDGQLAGTTVESDDVPGYEVEGQTVEGFFDEIQRAVDDDATEIRATYDTATGRPASFWIDVSEMMADEEHGIDVTDFVPAGAGTASSTATEPTTSEAVGPTEGPDVVTTGTSQPPSVRRVAEAQLTEPWACGFGFAATDVARTVALSLRATAAPALGASTVSLPDPGWTGEVQLGSDLLGVECADLDLARPATPDETWPVVGGTLQLDVPPSMGCGPTAPATAVVTALRVVAPDGTTITFPPLTLTNDQWGCAAG